MIRPLVFRPLTTSRGAPVLLSAVDIQKALDIITACEADLKLELSLGQQRDLLCDNTVWQSSYIRAMVDHINAVQA
jgi:hypothetical protein